MPVHALALTALLLGPSGLLDQLPPQGEAVPVNGNDGSLAGARIDDARFRACFQTPEWIRPARYRGRFMVRGELDGGAQLVDFKLHRVLGDSDEDISDSALGRCAREALVLPQTKGAPRRFAVVRVLEETTGTRSHLNTFATKVLDPFHLLSYGSPRPWLWEEKAAAAVHACAVPAVCATGPVAVCGCAVGVPTLLLAQAISNPRQTVGDIKNAPASAAREIGPPQLAADARAAGWRWERATPSASGGWVHRGQLGTSDRVTPAHWEPVIELKLQTDEGETLSFARDSIERSLKQNAVNLASPDEGGLLSKEKKPEPTHARLEFIIEPNGSVYQKLDEQGDPALVRRLSGILSYNRIHHRGPQAAQPSSVSVKVDWVWKKEVVHKRPQDLSPAQPSAPLGSGQRRGSGL